MKVTIKVEKNSDADCPYKNVVTVTGYTKYGISKQDLIDWADDTGGYPIQESPIVFDFYGEKGGQDDVSLDCFCSWLEAEDPNIVIRHQETI